MKLEQFIGNSRMFHLLASKGFPQASLLVGPAGVGKKTAALLLAKRDHCGNPLEQEPCGRCPSCIRADAHGHPDIRLYQPEKNAIRIDAMRELSREVHFRPFEGRLRFFIVDQAEKMTEEAANSILKTLEEPPETSRLVLISSLEHQLLPTIRSRCQIFPFRPLTREEIERYLSQRGEGENVMIRASFAAGSIGQALTLELEEVLQQRDRMLELLTSWCRTESFEAIYRTCESSPLRTELKNREKVRQYLDILKGLVQDLYFLLVDTPERIVSCDRLDELRPISALVKLNWVRGFLYHIDRSRWEIDHYLNPLICFETLWLLSKRAS